MKKRFTLIDLLLCVIILGILVAIISIPRAFFDKRVNEQLMSQSILWLFSQIKLSWWLKTLVL